MPSCTGAMGPVRAGVGPVLAQEMVTRLGTSVLDVLDSPSALSILQKCSNIGASRAANIKASWDASRGAPPSPARPVLCRPGR